jgi:methylthioribose-1-phosphate isomerase
MRTGGKHCPSLWFEGEYPSKVFIVNQVLLPFRFITERLGSPEEALTAITGMKVRGAPLIGATAAAGIYLALLNASPDEQNDLYLEKWKERFLSARPTAVNLSAMVWRMVEKCSPASNWKEKTLQAWKECRLIVEEEKEACRRIGEHGLPLIEKIFNRKKNTVNILTHCNAGRLACIDYGTATAPLYLAHEQGIPVHVWIDETRPRNQGARLTAWELAQAGIPHTVIVDNAGGYLMQKKRVDMVLVGSDRTTSRGDVANKIGTYLKALAAKDNGIPFYVALPVSSIDRTMANGLAEIPIEERSNDEVRFMEGSYNDQILHTMILPLEHSVYNPGFDITPAGLVSGLITDRGVCRASREGISSLFPDRP